MPRLEVPAGTYFINFASLDRDDSFSPAERDAIFKVIRDGHRTSYVLNAVVVMPDHVHMILQAVVGEEPVELPKIMHRIKGYGALQVNKLRGANGSIWVSRYYNRLIFSEFELKQKLRYIIDNPRKANMVVHPDDYPYLWYQGKGGYSDG
jgi:putative transposase